VGWGCVWGSCQLLEDKSNLVLDPLRFLSLGLCYVSLRCGYETDNCNAWNEWRQYVNVQQGPVISYRYNSCYANAPQFHVIRTLPIFFVLFVCSFVFGAIAPQRARASSFTKFLDHTQRCITFGRTLDE
jgi:hypothetical protein